jgi:small subunit ribosomal protein S6
VSTATESVRESIRPLAPQKRIPREYELVYILTPQVDADDAERIATRLQEVVAKLGGKITKVDQWGRRKLAYPIHKATRGVFVCVRMVGYSDLVAEIERNLRNADAVVRFQTVRLDTIVEALDKVTVDPEQVKFARVEAPSPDEVEPTVEERLGLNVKPRERDDYGMDDDDIPNLDEVLPPTNENEGGGEGEST